MKKHFSIPDDSLSMRFILPLSLENILGIVVTMVCSGLFSNISPSALAAIGFGNNIGNCIVSVFALVTSGAAVLVARAIGEGNYLSAKETTEQTLFLSVVTGVVLIALLEIINVPMLRLMMPNAEEELFTETVRYNRVLMLSIPPYIIHSAYATIARALGDSRSPLFVAILFNVLQVFFSWLLTSVFALQEIGAALATVFVRVFGMVAMYWLLARNKRYFSINMLNALKPKFKTLGKIVKIGVPMSIESTFVQIGYLVANTFAVALGSFDVAVYQILTTVYSLVGLPQGIVSGVAMSAIGHLVGADNIKQARRWGIIIVHIGEITGFILAGATLLLGDKITGFYSNDALIVTESAKRLYLLALMAIAGISINAMDPQLRSGGDVRFVMIMTLGAVWLVRLPLSYLFCFVLDWGVTGIFMANIISLWVRMIGGIIRHHGNKWLKKNI